MKTVLTIALGLVLLLSATAEAVELTIITSNGFVSFKAGDEWPVIGSQTNMPVAVMAFQIPDPADEGSPDSTNLAISFYDPRSAESQTAIAAIGKQYGEKPPVISHVAGWKVFGSALLQVGGLTS